MLTSDNDLDARAEVAATKTQNCIWRSRMRILIVVALLLRLVAAVAVDDYATNAGRQFLIEGDANGYWALAEKICAGDDYAIHTPPRYVLRVPGFPLLLSVSICVFGNNILAARIVLAIIGTACCWLTFRLGTEASSERAGFWAAAFVAINPVHVGNSVLILSETYFAFWMLMSLLALFRLLQQLRGSSADQTFKLRRALFKAECVGATIGVTVMVRPGFLPWLGVAVLAALAIERTRTLTAPFAVRILASGVMVIGCILVMLPWAVRNFEATGHLVFTSLWSGPSMYDGLNPNADGASNMQFFDDDNVMATMSEFEMNEHYKRKAIDFATANPGRTVMLALNKTARCLSPVPNFAKSSGWVVWVVCVVLWLALFGGVYLGIKKHPRDSAVLLVTVGPLLLFLLVHMVFVGSVRYRLPLEFPLSVLGAIGWCRLSLSRETSES